MKTRYFLLSCILIGVLSFIGCKDTSKSTASENADTQSTTANQASKKKYASDVIPFFDKWKLILGNGNTEGNPVNFENKDYFYTVNEKGTDWVVFKTPNAGDTHGTSNNTRTELAQRKKWSPMSHNKLSATLKVMNVSATGDATVASTHTVVVGQIHGADGHENEPFKVFYRKIPGHTKGSVFWNYEINTAGDDNGGRWDYSYPIWGDDFSTVGPSSDTYPPEPKDGIELGEEFSYVVEVKEGLMHLTFSSPNHETKTFTKNIVKSEYTTKADMPEQTKGLFVPIGQDGVERSQAYADEGCFFKLGCYNQTNGKDPSVNGVWCSGAETHGGDLAKQYESGNYAEVWFKTGELMISDDAYSNESYFTRNDHLAKRTREKK